MPAAKNRGLSGALLERRLPVACTHSAHLVLPTRTFSSYCSIALQVRSAGLTTSAACSLPAKLIAAMAMLRSAFILSCRHHAGGQCFSWPTRGSVSCCRRNTECWQRRECAPSSALSTDHAPLSASACRIAAHHHNVMLEWYEWPASRAGAVSCDAPHLTFGSSTHVRCGLPHVPKSNGMLLHVAHFRWYEAGTHEAFSLPKRLRSGARPGDPIICC